MLDTIWANRRGGRAYSQQYMEAVFAADAEQEQIARERLGDRAPIIVGAPFHLAEDYHQNYYLRHEPTLMRELAHLSPQELVDSTVAARLNSYIGGFGSPTRLHEDLPSLGLSAESAAHLEQLVARRARRA